MSAANEEPMTAAQQDAIKKAWDLLSEHFERCLLVVDWDIDAPNGESETAHTGYWHGGSIAAVGLAEFAKQRLLNSGTSTRREPGEEETP